MHSLKRENRHLKEGEDLYIDIKANELMKTATTVAPEDKVSDIIALMKKNAIYDLPVVDKKKLIGIISYEHLIKKRKLPLSSEACNIMISPQYVTNDTNIQKIAEKMFVSDLKNLPVVEYGKVVGIISRKDIIECLGKIKEIGNMNIKDVMTSAPVCAMEEEDIEKVKHTIADLGISTLPVVNRENKLVGIVSWKHLMKILEIQKKKERKGEIAGEKSPVTIPVRDLMDNPVSLLPNDKLHDAIKIMLRDDVSSVVITDNEKPVGIVSQEDILQLIGSTEKRDMVYVQITGLEEKDPDVYSLLYELIQKSMKKISSIFQPQMFTLHVSQYSREGLATKYSLRGRLSTEKKLFVASTFDWDLMKALSDLLVHLETQIRKEKGKFKMKPRRKMGLIRKYGSSLGKSR